MYMQGNKQYDYHVKTYGHPSKFGFKDTIPAWKAEKFDPDYLMELLKKAGAKYFMSMGVHHDNFDLWNSKYNRWNSVNMGPHKDIVGMWKKAVNNEAIYATMPWKTLGKGPQSNMAANRNDVNSAQQFNERNRKDLIYQDIRFTTKGNTLYVFFMGWPDTGSQVVIKSLTSNSPYKIGSIENIQLLGYGKVDFKRDEEGLKISLPNQGSGEYASSFKITGTLIELFLTIISALMISS